MDDSFMPQGPFSMNAARRLRVVLALAAGGMAFLVLLSTFFGARAFAALGWGLVPMSPLAAGMVILLVGAIQLMDARPASASARRLACALALMVALLNLGFVVGHARGGTTAFDGWLLQRWPRLQLTSLLTDMALLGAALAFLGRWMSSTAPWKLRQTAALMAMVPGMIGALVLVSYLAGAPVLYGTSRIPMSLPSALSVLVLSFSLHLSAGWDTWPLAAFRTGSNPDRKWAVFGLPTGAWTIFIIVGALVLAGGSFFLRGQLRETRTQVQDELKTIAALKARQISSWYGERRGDADQIARGALIQTQLRRFLAGSPSAPPEGDLRAWMEALQQGSYRRVVLFDGQGRVRISVPANEAPGALDTEGPELQQALRSKEVLVQDLHRNPGQPDIQLSLWVPIGTRPDRERAEGAMLLEVDPQQFLFPLIQSWPTSSPSAETLLVRRDGDDVLFLNDLRHSSHTVMIMRQRLADSPDQPATQSVLGTEGLVVGTDYRGIPVLAVLNTVPGTDWHMVAKVDVAEVDGPLRLRIWVGTLGLMGMLTLVAVGLGLMLKHRDAEMVRKQLRLSQRFEWLMREANDIILLLDREGHILEANGRAVERYGYSLSELLGKYVLDLRAPEARAEGKEQYEQLLVQGSIQFETIIQRKDGSRFPVEVSARALPLEGELRLINVVRDITERREQEKKILRMTQLYSALSQVNQSIVWSPTREALFDRICEAMVLFGKFDMAWVALDDPLSQRVSVAAECGDAKGYLDRFRVETGPSPLGVGPVGRAIREACPCIMNDFLGEVDSAPWHEAAVESGFRSVAAFPIRLEGEVIGALAVYANEKRFFGVHEEALLVEAALDISFAMDHLAGEKQRRRAEAALQESEHLLMEAQEAGGIGTYTWFIREDRWTSSPFLDRIFGIDQDYPRNLAGWTELVAPEFRDEMSAYVSRIIERHERFDLDYPTVRVSDGAARWVHGQGTIQRDYEGQPVALVGIIQDITGRKTAERSLRKISAAVEQSPLSIMITDPQGTIEYVNPAFTKVSGYTAEEVLGQNPRILKSPSTPQEHYGQMWETLARGEVWVGEFENLKKNGETFYERATIAPVRDNDGQLVGYIGIKDDITQFKQREAERHSLESQLQQSQKLESLGSLAGGVAHDMNNVLGAILGLASTLREAADPATSTRRNLDTIVTACMRGRGVVKSLLYFAKKDLQEERPIDLNDLVREMSQLLSHTTLQRIQLRMDLREGIGLLRGDPGALSHALMNLCVNATDAMPGGGNLHLRTDEDGEGGLTLSVLDSGLGMAPEVLSKAMEPFFTTKPPGKGTGLGLSMVYGTMMAHEGSFALFSEPGHGTEAVLRFPASRVTPRVPPADVTPAVSFTSQEALRVLLVDDDELIREAVAPLLEMLGHTVATAPGGAEALELIQSGMKVDLVILDMNMPGMGGAETLPRILDLCPGMPVIMATGYSDLEIAPLLGGRPTVTSIRKPFSLKELQLKISGLQIQPAGGT